ncbi:MAG: hypothetical protein GF418_13440 [Chitinivibrionales bacterium]|nr:hypothetical protein [Chitinivibrionales bacterium]MBD3396623.1 hypothetical protein [Chitinivibrionales bacterium]
MRTVPALSAVCLFLVVGVSHTEYRRPYGPTAPWNVPVAGLPLHPESDTYASRLYNDATASRPGNFNLSFDGYTYPVYHASDATGEYPVETTWSTNIDGTSIPWNPAWEAASGTDGQVIILDSATGREWNLWQVSLDGGTVTATNGNLVQAGEERGDGSQPANYWTKENGYKPSRGCGIQYFAMLVVPAEIEQGAIEHALSVPIINTDGDMFVAPATKLEYPDHPSNGIPEGMRFALDITDEDIDDWITSLPAALPDATRTAARVIAVALRDYGWFITDSSGGAHFQFEDRASAGAEWEALGLADQEIGGKTYPRDLLDGLITQDNIYAIVPSDEYGTTIRDRDGALPAPTGIGLQVTRLGRGRVAFTVSGTTGSPMRLAVYNLSGSSLLRRTMWRNNEAFVLHCPDNSPVALGVCVAVIEHSGRRVARAIPSF